MSLFVWYFGTRRRYEEVAHHTILLGPRYRACCTTSSSSMCWPRISASICTARPRRTLVWRRRAATPSTCCRRSRIWTAAPIGPSPPNLTAGRSRASSSRTVLPGLEAEIVTSRMMTPQDFQDTLLSYRGAAFGMEPRLTQSAWFRPHNVSEDVGRSLPRRRRHPSRRRTAGCAVFRQGPGSCRAGCTVHRRHGTPPLGNRTQWLTRIAPTSPPAVRCCAAAPAASMAAALLLPSRVHAPGDRALRVLPRRRRPHRHRERHPGTRHIAPPPGCHLCRCPGSPRGRPRPGPHRRAA